MNYTYRWNEMVHPYIRISVTLDQIKC